MQSHSLTQGAVSEIILYEDRAANFVGLQLAFLSLVRHEPQVVVHVRAPGGDVLEPWFAQYAQARFDASPVAGAMGWSVKPTVLLERLQGKPDGHVVCWMDTDIILTRPFTPLLSTWRSTVFVAGQEPYWGQEQGSRLRTLGWNLEPGRQLPITANSGVVRASTAHIPLLTRWKELMADERFVSAQSIPATQRPLHLVGDQDGLTALLGSAEFEDLDLGFLTRGDDIAQCFGPAGFTPFERIRAIVQGPGPALVHAMGNKPWAARHGREGLRGMRDKYENLHNRLAPYTAIASSYADELPSTQDWLGRPAGIRAASARELPLSVVDFIVKAIRSRAGIGRFEVAEAAGPIVSKRTSQGPDERKILSTLVADIDDEWNDLVVALRPVGKRGRPRDLLNLLRNARGKEVLILRGSTPAREWYRDLVFALLIKARHERPLILMTDATWEPRSAALEKKLPFLSPVMPIVAKAAIRLLDGEHMTYGVLSSEEAVTFSESWGIPAHRVVRLDFSHTLWNRGELAPTGDEGYLFAGGNSIRDYDLLEQALAGAQFDTAIASSWRPRRNDPRIEVGTLSHAEFLRRLAFCRASVVPLAKSNRSAGQQTYLNAMALGKPVVVTDALGVRDYIEHGVNGWIAPATPTGLRETLDFVMDDSNLDEVREVAERGRRMVLRDYTEFTYRQKLLSWADQATGRPR